MNEQTKQHEQAKTHQNEDCKPFEAPQLKREARLEKVTADRMFRFSNGS